MPFTPSYGRTKSFAAGGAALPGDFNSIQDDLGQQIVMVAPEDVVATMPGSPVDGQIVRYQNAAMATAGVVWTFRYRTGSASIYKWEFLGAHDLTAEVATQEGMSGSVYADLATVGPSLVLPLTGDYAIEWGANVVSGADCYTGLSINGSTPGTAASADDAIPIGPFGVTCSLGAQRFHVFSGLTAGHTVKLLYRAGSGVLSQWGARRLRLHPIRVA